MRTKPTHCVNGHEFNEENTYVWPKTGKWVCRACVRERMQRRRSQEKAVRVEVEAERIAALKPDLSTIDLAWAAGLFEGEGTVTITKAGRKGHTRGFVSVTNTDRDVVDFFHSHWGGHLRSVGKPSERAREAFEWRLYSSSLAAMFAEQILPYIKTTRVRQKMELLIEASATRQRGSRDPDYKARQHELRERMRKLNRRGETE